MKYLFSVLSIVLSTIPVHQCIKCIFTTGTSRGLGRKRELVLTEITLKIKMKNTSMI